MRKKNSKRALTPSISFVQSYYRKRVETAGSLIVQLLLKECTKMAFDPLRAASHLAAKASVAR
jgi:hypothetical protein